MHRPCLGLRLIINTTTRSLSPKGQQGCRRSVRKPRSRPSDFHVFNVHLPSYSDIVLVQHCLSSPVPPSHREASSSHARPLAGLILLLELGLGGYRSNHQNGTLDHRKAEHHLHARYACYPAFYWVPFTVLSKVVIMVALMALWPLRRARLCIAKASFR